MGRYCGRMVSFFPLRSRSSPEHFLHKFRVPHARLREEAEHGDEAGLLLKGRWALRYLQFDFFLFWIKNSSLSRNYDGEIVLLQLPWCMLTSTICLVVVEALAHPMQALAAPEEAEGSCSGGNTSLFLRHARDEGIHRGWIWLLKRVPLEIYIALPISWAEEII